eukprot:CAMPEP_0196582624 /NCGR_PEP_ID=MMETSP1081-20130531/39787_1 /TAXON_ID=36882 /ORGANISM="Pyramimonas amylifera, Strain CCMP720" /LENGTH=121 /DNA_ID=CAMNT_0041903243 /DNA_START=184 /DNA_END=545 /DNA_ORIENTATION=-
MLPFLVLDEVVVLQRGDDVVGFDGRHLAEVFDGDGSLALLDDVQQHPRPVAAVGEQAQVGQRALRCAHLAFKFGELVGKGNKDFSVSLPLELGERQDARQVVPFLRALFLGEVPHHVVPAL